MIKYFLLAIIFMGCGGPGFDRPETNPDFESANKSKHFLTKNSGMNPELARAMEENLLQRLIPYGFVTTINLRDSISVIDVYYWPTSWECHGAQNDGKWCIGEEKKNVLNVKGTPNCNWHNAYRHELLHWFEEIDPNGTGDGDPTHSRPEWAVVKDDDTMPCDGPEN